VTQLHVAVLMGGWSAEREVSLVSGEGVAKACEALGHRVTRIDMDRDVALRLHEANPDVVPPFQQRVPSKAEIAYARLAARTPHIVLSTTLERVSWPPAARIVRDVAQLRMLKGQPGKNTYVVGGATLVASLLNEGLIDGCTICRSVIWPFRWTVNWRTT